MPRGTLDGSEIMPPLIDDNLEEIGRLCRPHGVHKLEVFGSILRSDFDPQRSDVDVVVEFEPRRRQLCELP
jgi:predicted nucleotidyltransferase